MAFTQTADWNDEQCLAAVLAFVVRSELEDLHSAKTPMDESHMPEINRIIRDSIYTAYVVSRRAANGDTTARATINHIESVGPDYWEAPELLPNWVGEGS